MGTAGECSYSAGVAVAAAVMKRGEIDVNPTLITDVNPTNNLS